jgi:hypothetical protein
VARCRGCPRVWEQLKRAPRCATPAGRCGPGCQIAACREAPGPICRSYEEGARPRGCCI